MIALTAAQTIIARAFACARENGLKPIAAIIVDAGGHPVAYAREDGASLFRHDIGRAKAIGALGMGADSRVLAERAKSNPLFYQSVAATAGGNIVFSPGGVLIRDAAGEILGAVGISGDTGEQDEICALAGIAAAGLSGGKP